MDNNEKIIILEKENTKLRKQVEELSASKDEYELRAAELKVLIEEQQKVVEDAKAARESYKTLLSDCEK